MALFHYIVPHFNRKVCGLYNLIKDFEKKKFSSEVKRKKETETVGAAAVDFFLFPSGSADEKTGATVSVFFLTQTAEI